MIRIIFTGALLVGLSLQGAEVSKPDGQFGFTLEDLEGTKHPIIPEAASKAWVMVFISTECPIARSYVPALNRLAESHSVATDGVRFYGVLSDPTLSLENARLFAKEFGVRFPVLVDNSGKLAGVLTPTRVPEAFVLDSNLKIAYRGRIDDLYLQIGKRRQQPTEHTLKDAINAVLAGAPPKNARTEPVGCLFECWKDQIPGKSGSLDRKP